MLVQMVFFPFAAELWALTMPQTQELQRIKISFERQAEHLQPCWDAAVALVEASHLPGEQQKARESLVLATLRDWSSSGDTAADGKDHLALRTAGLGSCLGSWQSSKLARPRSQSPAQSGSLCNEDLNSTPKADVQPAIPTSNGDPLSEAPIAQPGFSANGGSSHQSAANLAHSSPAGDDSESLRPAALSRQLMSGNAMPADINYVEKLGLSMPLEHLGETSAVACALHIEQLVIIMVNRAQTTSATISHKAMTADLASYLRRRVVTHICQQSGISTEWADGQVRFYSMVITYVTLYI